MGLDKTCGGLKHMAELYKKKSYSIDMRESTKQSLVKLSRQLKLSQGDTISYLMDEFDRVQDRLIDASNNKELMQLMISQQNQLIAGLQEQNALLQRLVVRGDV